MYAHRIKLQHYNVDENISFSYEYFRYCGADFILPQIFRQTIVTAIEIVAV